MDSDTVNNEVLPQTQVLGSSTTTSEVEVETEERLLRLDINERSARGTDEIRLTILQQLSGQLPDEQRSPEASVKQTKEGPKSVGRTATQQKAYETTST